MIKVGITGGIGSGKSICCEIFRTLGVPIYQADPEAKALMETHPDIIRELKEMFGASIYIDGKLDRDKMAQLIFQDRTLLQQVNESVHPRVREHFRFWCDEMEQANHAYIVYEAAILFESGFYKEMDRTLLITAPEQIRITRTIKRDGSSEGQVKNRIKNQWSEEKKKELSDDFVINDDAQLVTTQILRLHKRYQS